MDAILLQSFLAAMNDTCLNSTTAGIFFESPAKTPYLMETLFAFALAIGNVGMFSCVLTMIMLTKLGFAQTIHISYFSLAISDLGVVLTSVLFTLLQVPKVSSLIMSKSGEENLFVLVFSTILIHTSFSRCTSLITTWVSIQRCFCVLLPMKVKSLITRRLTCAMMVVSFTVSFFPVFSGFASYLIYERNGKSFANALRNEKQSAVSIKLSNETLIYGICFITIITSTAVLTIKLKQMLRWRRNNMAVIAHPVNVATMKMVSILKQRRIIKTVLILACTIIIFSLPHTATFIASLTHTEFYEAGSLNYLFYSFLGISYVCHEINSSINLFVYAYIGSKYRETLKKILGYKQNRGL